MYEEKQFFLQERIAYGIRNFIPGMIPWDTIGK